MTLYELKTPERGFYEIQTTASKDSLVHEGLHEEQPTTPFGRFNLPSCREIFLQSSALC